MSAQIDGLDELVQEFVTECRELLEDVEAKLIELERSRSRAGAPSRSTLDAVFRAFHTMKGTAGFLGFVHFVEVTHTAEFLLDDLRQQRFVLAGDHVNVLVDALDVCRDALTEITAKGSDAGLGGRADVLVAAIRGTQASSLAGGKSGGALPAPAAAKPAPEAAKPEPVKAEHARAASSPSKSASPEPEPEPMAAAASIDLGAEPPSTVEVIRDFVFPSATEVATDATLDLGEAPPSTSQDASPKADEPTEEAPKAKQEEGGRKTIRVDVEKLDALVNLVGELILAENMVAHDEALAGLELDSFQKAILHLNRVTRGLHDIAMSVRMVAIEGLFKKMHRLVRDVSLKVGKEVELVISGEGTEVDKNLIEYIGDPLVHIMRNAIDHGLESKADRVAAGKSPVGTVRLEARHHGGEVWISVTDDGKGLDRERIIAKAVERGLVDPESAATWPDTRVFGLIFQPGFSTAEQVTEVSGRGVGMDVVLRNIQALKGRVEIASQAGQGSTFTLRIPLTLAIIEGMLVEVASSRFLIPLLSIRESFQLRAGMLHTLPDGREVTHVRGGFLPLVRLSEIHGMGLPRVTDRGLIVIVEHEGRSCGLHVDALLGQRQTVIKPLPDFFGEHPAIAGCSILSNGEIALILELGGIVPAGASVSSHNAHRDALAAHAA